VFESAWWRFSATPLAGGLYAAAGLYLTAITASGDPNAGRPFLLTCFAAMALGLVGFRGGVGQRGGRHVGRRQSRRAAEAPLRGGGSKTFWSGALQGSVILIALAIPVITMRLAASRRPSTDVQERVASMTSGINRADRGRTRQHRLAGPRPTGLPRRDWMRNQAFIVWVLARAVVLPLSRLASENFPVGIHSSSNVMSLGLFLAVIAFGQGLVVLTGGNRSVRGFLGRSPVPTSPDGCGQPAFPLCSPPSSAVVACTAVGCRQRALIINQLGVSRVHRHTRGVGTILASVLLGVARGAPSAAVT